MPLSVKQEHRTPTASRQLAHTTCIACASADVEKLFDDEPGRKVKVKRPSRPHAMIDSDDDDEGDDEDAGHDLYDHNVSSGALWLPVLPCAAPCVMCLCVSVCLSLSACAELGCFATPRCFFLLCVRQGDNFIVDDSTGQHLSRGAVSQFVQPAFQPASTPLEESKRFLVWNDTGFILRWGTVLCVCVCVCVCVLSLLCNDQVSIAWCFPSSCSSCYFLLLLVASCCFLLVDL